MNGIIEKTATGSVDEVIAVFVARVTGHGLHVFDVIDHSGAAREKGLALRDTKVVIFGSPEAGTPVMRAAPLVALDLPLKILIWDDDGTTRIAYTDPDALALRYDVSPELVNALRGIGPLTDDLAG